MRVRDHVVLSTAGAALIGPWAGHAALALWAGGVLIDADHYAWFSVSQGCVNPLAAIRFFGEADPPQHSATRALHSPPVCLAALLMAFWHRRLRPIALGMGLHVALDQYHESRMDRARAAALTRDDFTCQVCGTRSEEIGTHLWRQPCLLPSYRTENLVTLCGPCHESAHRFAMAEGKWS